MAASCCTMVNTGATVASSPCKRLLPASSVHLPEKSRSGSAADTGATFITTTSPKAANHPWRDIHLPHTRQARSRQHIIFFVLVTRSTQAIYRPTHRTAPQNQPTPDVSSDQVGDLLFGGASASACQLVESATRGPLFQVVNQ